jgi:hypothetical protein
LVVAGVEVGVQQANSDRVHTGLAQRPRALPDLLLIERYDDLSVRRGDALFDGEPVAPPCRRAGLPTNASFANS